MQLPLDSLRTGGRTPILDEPSKSSYWHAQAAAQKPNMDDERRRLNDAIELQISSTNSGRPSSQLLAQNTLEAPFPNVHVQSEEQPAYPTPIQTVSDSTE